MQTVSIRRWWPSLAALLAVLLGAAAQADELRIEPPESPLACLTPKPSDLPPIAYPDWARERARSAVVGLRLTFTTAEEAPRIEVLSNTGDPAFEPLAKEQAKNYRLPCLKPGAASVVATQEFTFDPRDGRPVSWTGARNELATQLTQCLHIGNERYTGQERPHYPNSALSDGQSGTVLVRLQFHSGTQAPQIDILFDANSKRLARAVKEFAQDYRLPCLESGEPVEVFQSFKFRIAGAEDVQLRDVTLAKFVRALRPEGATNVRFELSSMNCPFDVRLRLYQPYAKNSVGEVGSEDARRQPLLQWLRGVTLNISPEALNSVLGGEMQISVPCGVLDLT